MAHSWRIRFDDLRMAGTLKKQIRPTFGEFDIDTDNQEFLRQNFWHVIKKECPHVLRDLQDAPLALYQKEFGTFGQIDRLRFQKDNPLYPQVNFFYQSLQTWRSRWNLRDPIATPAFDERFEYDDEKTEWINDFATISLFWWKLSEQCKEEMTLNFPFAYIGDIETSPKVEGLEVWRYREEKAEGYIERQRKNALAELNETSFASLPADVKNYIANSRAKQAEDYCSEVTGTSKLKTTPGHAEFERNLTNLVRLLCGQPKPTWNELAAESLKEKGLTYTKNEITLNKEIRALKKGVKEMLPVLGFSQSVIFGKQGRPSKSN